MKKRKQYHKPLLAEMPLDCSVSIMMVSEGGPPDPNSPWASSQPQDAESDVFKTNKKDVFPDFPNARSPFD